jgi:hypothetical protein
MAYESNNYKLIQEEKIDELNAVARVFEHIKSGAKALLLSNDDDNKVFSVTFRTPPTDDTGLPHILEHSVLCGSKEFPAKDPFVELAKGSLNTFLNAMTFSDKTMYPVASCNEKDFENLMHVYMDAVFYPNIYHRPEILKQEGWHYDLESLEGPITYKGVVYNEMKGAFSSPEQVMFRKIQASLFPDTPYAKESGGDPDFITDLTHEDFLDYHKKYYHPSNSYIFLYGNFDIEKKLEWLDSQYLSHFDKIEIDSSIPIQESFNEVKEVVESYSISNNEDEKDKTYLSYNYVVGTSTDIELYYGFEILEYLLLEAPGAPLKKALLDAGIGKDVFGSYDNSIQQPTLTIVAKDTNEDQKEVFVQTIQKTLKDLAQNGLNKKSIEAAINYYEFKIREADYGRYPKGVIYAMMHLNTWLYDADPLLLFKYNDVYKKFREGIDNGYFEKLIETYLLENTHATLVIVKPEKGLTAKKEKELENKLSEYKSSLSEAELHTLMDETRDLEKYQETPSKKEELETIPLLNLEDLKRETEPLPLEVIDTHQIKLLFHPVFTNNIGYVKYIFDTKHVPEHLVPYIGLLTQVLGKVDTKNYSYDQLASEINIHTGGIFNVINVYGHYDMAEVFLPKFEIKARAFYEKIPTMFELVKEIIFNTKLEDTKRLSEIVLETKSRLQMQLNGSGHTAAANRAMSHFSNTAYYKELTGGISYYKFIERLAKDFDEKKEEIVSSLKELMHYIFRRENFTVSYTAEKSAFGIFENELEVFVNTLFTDTLEESNLSFDFNQRNEGYLTSGKIQYVAKAGNFVKAGFKYSGVLKVLQTIAGLDYLWNNVRVKGGAYGCMCGFSRNGNVYLTSYRDPNLRETLNRYNHLYDYIKTFHAEDRDMTKYIIGTISNIDRPMSPSLKGETAVAAYFNKLSNEDMQRERDEVLNTKQEHIRDMAELVHEVLKQEYICVVGNENKLEENKELFHDLVQLFE